MEALSSLHDCLGALFRVHGAVPLSLPPFWLKEEPCAAAPLSLPPFWLKEEPCAAAPSPCRPSGSRKSRAQPPTSPQPPHDLPTTHPRSPHDLPTISPWPPHDLPADCRATRRATAVRPPCNPPCNRRATAVRPPCDRRRLATARRCAPCHADGAYVLDCGGRLLELNQGGRLAIAQYVALHGSLGGGLSGGAGGGLWASGMDAGGPHVTGAVKCYSFSHSLRRNHSGGLPKEQLLADFDILAAPTGA